MSERRRPPFWVNFAKGNAIIAAPNTVVVCASPANDSDLDIEVTSSDPAATVPEVPTPLRICAALRVRITLRC